MQKAYKGDGSSVERLYSFLKSSTRTLDSSEVTSIVDASRDLLWDDKAIVEDVACGVAASFCASVGGIIFVLDRSSKLFYVLMMMPLGR